MASDSIKAGRKHVTRHTSPAARHLLLYDIRLALQRFAVAVDAVELGLMIMSAWLRKNCAFKRRFGSLSCSTPNLQRSAVLVDGRQLSCIAVHLRLHRASALLKPWHFN